VKSAQPNSNGVRRPTGQASREYLELWIHLARRSWGSLVILPADRDGSTAEIANALADIGQRLSYGPVTAITVSSLEYGSALALADLQQHLERERRRGSITAPEMPPEERPVAEAKAGSPTPAPSSPPPSAAAEHPPEPPLAEPARTEALAKVPPARLIISIPPVLTEPLGLTATQQSDVVVLAVRMNRSRMDEVRRTLELVGRERVIGCFLVR
jgi:hypothetical protein